MSDSDTSLLLERARISETICRWTACLDLKDWTGFGQQFTDPVEIAVASTNWDSEAPPRPMSRDQWVNLVRTALKAYSAFQHVVTVYKIEISGDTAYTESYVMAPHIVARTNRNLFLGMGGYYTENMRKLGGGCLFSRHKLHIHLPHGEPEALALIAPENRADELK